MIDLKRIIDVTVKRIIDCNMSDWFCKRIIVYQLEYLF